MVHHAPSLLRFDFDRDLVCLHPTTQADRFNNAINGYWGPLLSWLLVPFLYFGATHIFAINALNLIFGLLTIAGTWKLSLRFEISDKIRMIILVPLVPIFQFISLIQPMDFLLLCILGTR